jgi:hypothetical protein
LVKEQLGVDLGKPVAPPPHAQPIPSADPRDSFGSGRIEPMPDAPVEEPAGGGTRLSSLLDEEVRPPEPVMSDRRDEAGPPLGQPAYAYKEPPPRAFREVRSRGPDDADRKLGSTVALIFALLFSPPLQDKLAEYLPSAFVFRENWTQVLVWAAIIGLPVYAVRRFFVAVPSFGRGPPQLLERVAW